LKYVDILTSGISWISLSMQFAFQHVTILHFY